MSMTLPSIFGVSLLFLLCCEPLPWYSFSINAFICVWVFRDLKSDPIVGLWLGNIWMGNSNNPIIFAQNSISIDLQKWYHHFQRLYLTLVRKFGCPIRSHDEIWLSSVHFSLIFEDFSPFIQFFDGMQRFLQKINPIFVKSIKNATKYAAESSELFQTTKFSRCSTVNCFVEYP